MTIPSRPAPGLPISRVDNAAGSANASIEQLRLQMRQHTQQQINGDMQKLTIKLPPPPKRPINNNNNSGTSTSITRHFPQARYSPATSWDDQPFQTNSSLTLTDFKKVPPPRPPPPKIQGNAVASIKKNKALSMSIFRKKSNSNNNSKSISAARIYGVSSGKTTASSTLTTKSITSTSSKSSIQENASSSSYGSWSSSSNTYGDLNACWNSTPSDTQTIANNTTMQTQDAQLITFDSPPSSPTFTQKSNSDCLSVDSFSSDSNFSSPNNGSASQPESGFEDDFHSGIVSRSRPATTSPIDPWETVDAFGYSGTTHQTIGTAPVRNLNSLNSRPNANSDNPLCNGKSILPPTASLNMPTIIKPKISQKPKAPKPPILTQKPFINSAQNFGRELETPPSPPMPQFSPPLPPKVMPSSSKTVSILDVIAGRADAQQLVMGNDIEENEGTEPYGVALYDFEGPQEGDLSFRENDKIYLLEEVNAEWCRGRARSGCEGIFPTNYIDIKVPLIKMPTTSSSSEEARSPQVRCLYNFPAEVSGDLPLKENDFVTIIYKINDDWLYGKANGLEGQFPTNFLEYVPDNIPMP